MYKLFLWLKYLRRRYLAWLSAVAVALCVFMMLTSISVMDGFLAKAEVAAKGLFGDIIIDPASVTGIGRYDEFISRLTGEYRVDGDFRVVARRGTNALDFQADAGYVHVEALVGTSTVAATRTFPGRGLLYENDRFLCELRGDLRLTPDGKVGFLGRGEPLPKGATFGQLRLEAVYAKVGDGLPEVEAATPVVNSFGLLRAGRVYLTTIQICGIRLPERTRVTSFEEGLFVQAGDPNATFSPSPRQVIDRTLEHAEAIERLFRAESDRPEEDRDPMLMLRLSRARENLPADVMLILAERAKLAAERARAGVGSGVAVDLLAERVERQTAALAEGLASELAPPSNPVILGLGIGGLSFRAPTREHVRSITPGTKVVLTLLPVGRGGGIREVNPNTATFRVVDDAKTDVYTIDTRTVYVPFEKLQLMADLYERRDIADPTKADPARCSQIQVKVRRAHTPPAKLAAVRRKIEREWLAFYPKYEREFDRAKINTDVRVQTWYEHLAHFVGPIQKQRTLVALMFGVISFVAVILIFAIFYMIVMQKIRDIGVVRAVGGSAAGVAQVFLAFGAAAGLVGSLLGVVAGCAFVWNINAIHDWLGRTVGFQVWTPETYLFDEIPNQVDPAVVVAIVVWAVFSGLVGALIPAVRAAVMEPAEAVRYG